MQYTLKHIVKALEVMAKEGIEGILIGDTCLNIELGNKFFEGDLDLFVTSLSPLMESSRIIALAEEKGWSTGATELGTPSVTITVNNIDITVELYENIMDFYIPQEIIDICQQEYNVEGSKIRCISKECWIVLKARRGSSQDLSKISFALELIERNNIKIDKNKLKKAVEAFAEDAYYICERLRSLGLKI
ncbi:MAG: nucleotidyltransferase [Ignisphaera sp.]|jgi:predicted nucleotidyltransferase|nr:nucleotidyltransferase [Ignisphaera sp.]MCC6055507.1 nucleotidyltransferase [Desulfurococcaceae archaeon]